MDRFIELLKQRGFEGDIDNSETTRRFYSHDASLFEMLPELVVFPRGTQDLQHLVVSAHLMRHELPSISLTARSAGTCMSGGAINDSVVVDFTRYMNKIEDVQDLSARVQSGALYRDFEKATLGKGALLPTFPASRELAAIGGMVANNAGGEKSLQYGKTEDYVDKLSVVLSDGQAYQLKGLNKQELEAKKAQNNFEGQVYQQMFNLLDKNYDKLKAAKPHVSKNSTGYNLWDVWNRESGVFDLTKVFSGSQGTLGLIADINFRLVHDKPHSGVLVCFMKNLNGLGELINVVTGRKPASFE